MKDSLSAAYQVWFMECIDVQDAKLSHNPEDSIINFLSLSDKARNIMEQIMLTRNPPKSKEGIIKFSRKQIGASWDEGEKIANEIFEMGVY